MDLVKRIVEVIKKCLNLNLDNYQFEGMWTLKKINQYISDGIEENIHLDYKGAASLDKKGEKKKEISKDVSAFTNSDGGVIIYGVKEYDEAEKRHLPEKIDAVNGNEFSKEWLEQIINSNISPRITGIKITPVQTSKPEANQVVFVVEIPKGTTAHQASDKRYYKRFNFESIPMDDWEIKDIINRQNRTDIKIDFVPRIPKEFLKRRLESGIEFNINFEVRAFNKGTLISKYLDIFIYGDQDTAKYFSSHPLQTPDYQVHFSNEEKREIEVGDNKFVIGTDRLPILPNVIRSIGHIELSSLFIIEDCSFKIQVSTEDGTYMKKVTRSDLVR
ncbi:putative transcriptional regulator with HTH domain [Owenweeksia hongkongensis DSM 17368]|uniref:Putative transcriptional regulator with HTH domain n=1 Tax=Owenweeksia hongkongensis (strain DSM 17368 / CIP 108786 / JCM 12287 / NRRL B-23963 / UST20020801) TaxID=926562 RepID=G8QZV6_OWEHD|nr:ATP-binding protein [Owenweeksia hongkongensis]AEV31550.1 putative transcriptional regulator with HTH domain [Owenweeksia hongkongensis DSM 17368]